MELETINKLYLELSQIATAKTKREIDLERALMDANEICRSIRGVCRRNGKSTNWEILGKWNADQIQVQNNLLRL